VVKRSSMFDRLAISVTFTTTSSPINEEENKLETEWRLRFEIEERGKLAENKVTEV
jgi:hypothetical protein